MAKTTKKTAKIDLSKETVRSNKFNIRRGRKVRLFGFLSSLSRFQKISILAVVVIMAGLGGYVYLRITSAAPQYPTNGYPCSVQSRPVLRRGSSGTCVRHLQNALKWIGQRDSSKGSRDLVVDGRFGPATESAVKKFQGKVALGCTSSDAQRCIDGIVGRETWRALAAVGCGFYFGLRSGNLVHYNCVYLYF